jgi:hypothetical protein
MKHLLVIAVPVFAVVDSVDNEKMIQNKWKLAKKSKSAF